MKELHMNFSQLQSFLALAETKSFTEAAFMVGLTQSAVSHSLAALENELGVVLFERNRTGIVRLTSVGKKILPHARALLVQADAIEQEAKAAQGVTAGKLRLGSTLSLVSPTLLVSIMTSFRSLYPDIEVVLFEGLMHEVGEWISSGIVDVGFVILPAPGIETTLVATDELCVLLPAEHALHSRRGVTSSELFEEGFIMEKSQCVLQLMKRIGGEAGKSRPLVRYQASDSSTILAMVREGLGVTLMPRSLLPTRLDGIVALSLDPPQTLEIGLAIRSSEMASPAARHFVETAVAQVRERARKKPQQAVSPSQR